MQSELGGHGSAVPKKKKILLVEDNIDHMDIMQRQLAVLGYETVMAKNGLEAVEIAGAELPDMIVMDMLMPVMNGFQATERIRRTPKIRNVPILAATVLSLPGDRERCIASGCDDYLSKPFTYRQLEAVIKRLLKDSP